MFDLEDLLQPVSSDETREWTVPPLSSNLDEILENTDETWRPFIAESPRGNVVNRLDPPYDSFRRVNSSTRPVLKRRRENSLIFEGPCETSNFAANLENRATRRIAPHNGQVDMKATPLMSRDSRRSAPSKIHPNKARKCFREKQRRAEMSKAYARLAKRLGLPGKTEKLQLIKTADSTIAKLQQQVSHLQQQLTVVSFLPCLQEAAKKGEERETQRKTLPLPSFTASPHVPIRPRSEPKEIKREQVELRKKEEPTTVENKKESSTDTLKEMKSLVEKVESLYKLHAAQILVAQSKNDNDEDEEVTVSHCA